MTSSLSSTLQQASDSGVSLKLLCPTRWTARTLGINAILKDYNVLLEVLEEIHMTTPDEYGTKASGLLHLLEKFNKLLGLKLSYLLFSAAERLSLSLQKKNIAIQDALSAVEAAKEHFKHLRSDEEFIGLYEKVPRFAEEKGIEQPLLPRNRRQPQRHDTGSEPHHFSSVKEYYRKSTMKLVTCYLVNSKINFKPKRFHLLYQWSKH